MFFILEIQKQHDGSCTHIVQTADTEESAQMIYHQVLAAAAVSALACHSALIIDNDGHVIRGERYNHAPSPGN